MLLYPIQVLNILNERLSHIVTAKLLLFYCLL